MLYATITARNNVKVKSGDRLRVVQGDGSKLSGDIMITGPGGFLAYPDAELYIEFAEFFENKADYNDYEMYVEEIKGENTYGVLLLKERSQY